MNCPICFTEKNLVSTKCNHELCEECMAILIIDSNSCPMCRASLEEQNFVDRAVNKDKNINQLITHLLTSEDEVGEGEVEAVFFKKLLDKVIQLNIHPYVLKDTLLEFQGNYRLLEIYFSHPKTKTNLSEILSGSNDFAKVSTNLLKCKDITCIIFLRIIKIDYLRYNDKAVFDLVHCVIESIMKSPDPRFKVLDTIEEIFGSRFQIFTVLYAIKYDNVEALRKMGVTFHNPDLFVKLCSTLNNDGDYPMEKVGLFALNNMKTSLTSEQFLDVFINTEPKVFKVALDLLTIEEAICIDVYENMIDSNYFEENWEYYMSECKKYFSNLINKN